MIKEYNYSLYLKEFVFVIFQSVGCLIVGRNIKNEETECKKLVSLPISVNFLLMYTIYLRVMQSS